MNDISIIMPVLGAVFTMVAFNIIIVYYFKLKISKISSRDIEKFEELSRQLREDSQEIKKEVSIIGEKICKIDSTISNI